MPPQLLHPTITGNIVVLPSTAVVVQVLSVHREFVATLVENPGGMVVIVELTTSEVGEESGGWNVIGGGTGGGGGKGEPQKPKLHGNSQALPPELGKIFRPTTTPEISVVVVSNVEVNAGSADTTVGEYVATEPEAVMSNSEGFNESGGL